MRQTGSCIQLYSESILLYCTSKCKQTKEQDGKGCLWTNIVTFLCDYYQFFFQSRGRLGYCSHTMSAAQLRKKILENLAKRNMKIGGGKIRSLNYVSMFQNFIFRYYNKLDIKYVTTLLHRMGVCVITHSIFLIIMPYTTFSFCFIPTALKVKDINWKLSRLLYHHLYLFEKSTLSS